MVFYKTDKLYKVLYYIYIRIIHTKITATLPQIEYVSKICNPDDSTELFMHK